MSKDYYAVLSLPRTATQAEIRSRFLELARQGHPDRFTGEAKKEAERAFQDVTEAFNMLSDPARRHQHNVELDRPTSGQSRDPDQAARVYLNRGIRAYREQNYIEAAGNFDRATQANPQSHQAWHHLALTCLQEQRWLPKAQAAITRACELRPNQVSYLKMAGKIFGQSGMVKEAREYYTRALRLDDMDPSIHKALQALERPSRTENPSHNPESTGKTGFFRKIW